MFFNYFVLAIPLLADLLFVSFACILACDLTSSERQNNWISISFGPSIFWNLSDKTRNFVNYFVLAIPLLADLLFVSFACILVCDLTSSERQNNWISIHTFNFIAFHQMNILKSSDKTRHSFQLFCPLLYLCFQTCYLWALLASLFAILHLVNDKITEFRFSHSVSFSLINSLKSFK